MSTHRHHCQNCGEPFTASDFFPYAFLSITGSVCCAICLTDHDFNDNKHFAIKVIGKTLSWLYALSWLYPVFFIFGGSELVPWIEGAENFLWWGPILIIWALAGWIGRFLWRSTCWYALDLEPVEFYKIVKKASSVNNSDKSAQNLTLPERKIRDPFFSETLLKPRSWGHGLLLVLFSPVIVVGVWVAMFWQFIISLPLVDGSMHRSDYPKPDSNELSRPISMSKSRRLRQQARLQRRRAHASKGSA